MNRASLCRNVALQAFVILGLFSGACLDVNTTPNGTNTCTTGTAEIQVDDGQMIRLCGCVEASNQTFANGSTLTCTVAAGTHVFFSFVNITTNREFTVQGIQPCPLFSPSTTTATCAVLMNFTGNFPFSDLYSNARGTLIVQ
jgi:hypothetical protein